MEQLLYFDLFQLLCQTFRLVVMTLSILLCFPITSPLDTNLGLSPMFMAPSALTNSPSKKVGKKRKSYIHLKHEKNHHNSPNAPIHFSPRLAIETSVGYVTQKNKRTKFDLQNIFYCRTRLHLKYISQCWFCFTFRR